MCLHFFPRCSYLARLCLCFCLCSGLAQLGLPQSGLPNSGAKPRAPRPDLRLEAVRQLNLAGVDAGVICAPVLPEITDHARDLESLVKAASEVGAKYIYANPLFLKPCSAAVFLPFLAEHFPALVDGYKKRYQSRAFLPRGYSERLSQLMSTLRQKYKVGNEHARRSRSAQIEEAQMELF